MKKEIPKEFLREYESKRNYFAEVLDCVSSLLTRRLGQMAARTGVRGRVADKRVKRPRKLWKKAHRAKLAPAEAFTRVEDVLGIRIVCNNLSDIEPIVEMIRKEGSSLIIKKIKDMVSNSLPSGYRATHVLTEYSTLLDEGKDKVPCEIQIRTLTQDTWARLSRDDLYGNKVPESIAKMSRALSTHLSAIDEIAQLIRDELNQIPTKAEKIKDSDVITPQRLALLYTELFGEEIYEWTLVDWVEHLREAEIERIGEVRSLLSDESTRKHLDKLAMNIRKFDIEDAEWVVYSAQIAGEINKSAGIKAVRRAIQRNWDEIVSTARNDMLSGLPETFQEFVNKLRAGSVSCEAMRELGGIQDCKRCGNDILRPECAAEAVWEYYGEPDVDMGELGSLFMQLLEPEVESVDFSGYCQFCGHQMLKDD